MYSAWKSTDCGSDLQWLIPKCRWSAKCPHTDHSWQRPDSSAMTGIATRQRDVMAHEIRVIDTTGACIKTWRGCQTHSLPMISMACPLWPRRLGEMDGRVPVDTDWVTSIIAWHLGRECCFASTVKLQMGRGLYKLFTENIFLLCCGGCSISCK